MLVITFLSAGSVKAETFAEVFKPLRLKYLYTLFDNHPERHSELNAMFAIKNTYNVKGGNKKKVIAYSLFWKPPFADGPMPVISEEAMYRPSPSVKRNQPFYDKFIKSLLAQVAMVKRHFPGWIMRVYLADDLKFLIPRLLAADMEIFLMASNSIAAAPGSMWRFLVFDDPKVAIAYIRDADELPARLNGDFRMSKQILKWASAKAERGFFRIRDFGRWATQRVVHLKQYSPILASAFGAKRVRWLDMQKAMKGYILHRTLFCDEGRHPTDIALRTHPYGFGNEFPSYGFDERFLKHVIYFEAVDRGQLKTIPSDRIVYDDPSNHFWIKLDLEYLKSKAGAPKQRARKKS